MADPFIGEIRMFAGNFAPRGWAFCDGQLVQVSQNEPLFSLLGTIYGGDGRTTFGLPDLRGRVPNHMGQGPGLSARSIGLSAGSETATVSESEIPPHTHGLMASGDLAGAESPGGNVLGQSEVSIYSSDTPLANMSSSAITSTGGDQSHANLMPFLCVNFIIALFGIFPSRN